MRSVTYTGKLHLGGAGIGKTAMHQVRPLLAANLLEKAFVADATDEFKEVAALVSLPGRMPVVLEDFAFDSVVAIVASRTKLLQSWLSHSLFTYLNNTFEFYVVNCFSAHITEQRRLLEQYSNKRLVHPLAERKVLRELELATHILCPSEFVLSTLRKHGLAGKAKLIPFGVDTEKFKPGEKRDDVFRVLFVGRNWIRKGLPLLLAAWEELKLQNAELHIVGVELKEPIEGVKAEAWVDDIVAAYQNADVFCLPAIEDGCPLVTYEAFACGLPVIVSNTTGTAQHVWNGENGFVIETGDVSGLADVLQWFYDNRRELERMRRLARETALEWTWSRFESEYVKWISGILDGTV